MADHHDRRFPLISPTGTGECFYIPTRTYVRMLLSKIDLKRKQAFIFQKLDLRSDFLPSWPVGSLTHLAR